jgi:hypothetical protein
MNGLDTLWGGIIVGFSFDVVSHEIMILVEIIDGSEREKHRLHFTQVSEARFFNSIPEPWSYADLTEIHSDTTLDGSVLTEIVLWTEEAGLSIRSKEVILDGKIVEGAQSDRGR